MAGGLPPTQSLKSSYLLQRAALALISRDRSAQMATLFTFGKDEKCYGEKNPSDLLLYSAEGSKPHWPWDGNHVARDGEHVTYFLPNPLDCWRGGCTHHRCFCRFSGLWFSFYYFFLKATEQIRLPRGDENKPGSAFNMKGKGAPVRDGCWGSACE